MAVFFFVKKISINARRLLMIFISSCLEFNKCQMLSKWFNGRFKLIDNSNSTMESIKNLSSSSQNVADETSEQTTISKLIDASPANVPFRKKAITSIERTRKLSILLKHQHYLVSYVPCSFYVSTLLYFWDKYQYSLR